MNIDLHKAKLSRRDFVQKVTKGVGVFIFGGLLGRLLPRSRGAGTVWQIDPRKCIQCGNCAVQCVRTPSAVKCAHDFGMCGYCRICSGFFVPDAPLFDEGAENQLCPTGAIKRRFIEEPYFEYTFDKDLCIGCGQCVKGCASYGNGSLYLQIDRTLCLDCNECSISRVCEGKAIARIPALRQYIPKRII